MSTNTTQISTEPRGTDLRRGIGLQGRVAVFWGMGGGILLGGVLVAMMTLGGQLSGHGLFITSSGLFVIGALLGLLHGGALGFVGRPEGVSRERAWKDLGLSVLYAVPALALAWLVTVWIAMTMVASYLGRIGPMIGVSVGWAIGIVTVVTGAVYGWRALVNAYARWPERQAGTVFVTATFAALLVLFLADRPELWGLRMRVTDVGAVLLAVFASIWLAVPLVTGALRLLRTIPGPRPELGFATRRWAVDVGLGLAVGVILGLVAVPFAVPGTLATSGGAAMVGALSQALVDEVLLRLVLMTAVVWLLLRWHRVHREEAVVASVAVVALVQVILYTPGVLATGFATPLAATGFLVVAVAVPALVFGALYWLRGFGTALVADATSVIALALLAL